MRRALEQYLLDLAVVASSRCTCPKRSVGAVVANDRNIVVATGYNGTPRGLPHCSDTCDCGGIHLSAPESYAVCLAVHAEANALLAAGKDAVGGTLALTCAPCRDCAKLIVNAGIRKVIFYTGHRLFDAPDQKWSASKILDAGGVLWDMISS